MTEVERSLHDVEAEFGFSFPEAFHLLYDEMWNSRLFAEDAHRVRNEGEILLLAPEEMVAHKACMTHPHLLPIMVTYLGDCFCYHLPDDLTGTVGRWVFFDHEEGGCCSLGQNAAGCMLSVALEVEREGLARRERHEPPYSSAQGPRAVAREIVRKLSEVCRLGQRVLLSDSESWPYFGFEHSPAIWINSIADAMGVTVPFFVDVDAQTSWQRGDLEGAWQTWERAYREAPWCSATRWARAVVAATRGDSDVALVEHAHVVEGDWCTASPLWPGIESPWHAIPIVSAQYLSSRPDQYRRCTGSPLVCEIVLSGAFSDPSAWGNAMMKYLSRGQLREAESIALNGLPSSVTWGREGIWRHSCYDVLNECCERRGLLSRSAGLRRELGGTD